MNSSETNTWIRADANTPSKIKGIASSTMLKKMEFTFNKDAGMAKSFVFISTKKNSNQKALVTAHQLGLYLTVIESS